MAHDIQRSLRRIQALNDIKTGLIDSTLWLLGILKRDANLVAQLRLLIFPEFLLGLCKVVFQEVEELGVVVLGDAGVVEDEGAVGDECVCGLATLGLDCFRGWVVFEIYVQVDDGEIHGELGLSCLSHGDEA